MDFQLLVVRGRSASEALNLADGVTTLGRSDECQLRIKSSQVSRRHCEFFEKKGLLIVKDLGSANGTFVNEKKVAGQQVLEPGDELTIGPVKLRVAKVGQAPPVRTPVAPAVSDTALGEAIALPDADEDVDFQIDFDEETPEAMDTPAPVAEVKPAKAAATPEPVKSTPEPAKKAPAEPAKKAASEPTPVPAAPDMADEAIADFLLDIKLDEDE